MLNVDLKNFKNKHLRKENQVIYVSENSKSDIHINNLLNNFLNQYNSFVFESLERVRLEGDIHLVKILIKFGNLIIIKVFIMKKEKKNN